MEQTMFCFQCEQTAGCTGCTGARGVCGKTAQTARLQDQLTGALIGLARAIGGDGQADGATWRLLLEGLFATITNVYPLIWLVAVVLTALLLRSRSATTAKLVDHGTADNSSPRAEDHRRG